jgi:uncharacterized BrkB/YihY/UPF0761 family membrane protein
MSMPEQAGKVVSGTVDALKGQPLALALVIINVMFLAGGMWTAHDFFQRLESASLRKDTMVEEMMKRCMASLPKEDKP